MTPTAYLSELEQRLACIPAEDRTEIIQFYQEFLEDGGEAAMAELGTPDVLAQRILQENGYAQVHTVPDLTGIGRVVLGQR